MSRSITFCILLHAFLLHKVCGQRQEKIPDKVDFLVESLLYTSGLPGIAISIRKADSLLYAKGFGFSHVENQLPMTPSTMMRAASVSKVITITGLAKLHSQGLLAFDERIGKYIPDLTAPHSELTIRQVASHTAGLPHRPASNKVKRQENFSTKELIETITSMEPLFSAGSNYRYSSLGYNLLAGVIEGASGKSFLTYMQEDIFKKLGMKSTRSQKEVTLLDNFAQIYYQKKGKARKDRKALQSAYKLPGAGFVTTANDLTVMMGGYENGFIAASTTLELAKPTLLNDSTSLEIGLGWRLGKDMQGRKTLEHAGSWQGSRVVLVYYPSEGLSISIMINSKCTLFIEETAHLLAQLFLDNQTASVPKEDFSRTVTFYSGSNVAASSQGIISMNVNGRGKMQLELDYDFLKEVDLIHTGIDNRFAAITAFGLLHTNLTENTDPIAEIYLYQAMEKERKPFLILNK